MTLPFLLSLANSDLGFITITDKMFSLLLMKSSILSVVSNGGTSHEAFLFLFPLLLFILHALSSFFTTSSHSNTIVMYLLLSS